MPVEEDEDEEGEQFVYREDWGEALSTRSVPVLCALDLEGSSISVLEGVPEHLSPGQDLLLVDTEAATVTNLTAVNYRGSLGFGQAGISSLLSRVGEQDVADTQLAVEQALRSEPLDPRRLALLAGSHGAFIALHLLAREPERYRACALRSPVSNLPALLGTSDIPDWRYTSLGLPYSFERVPRAEEVATMLLRSPIAQAAQVRTPVLLCVGARDRRVSPTQALELYRVLRARGVPVRLLWYPEGGHTLAGAEMEADVFRNCARWLLRHLGQPPRDRTEGHRP
ncbi:acylamino-acid-releasing enzyme-like [Grus japonensis]|uniref:Acylamino-acid-releasing enzyme-like n=1 Tax=Grus japonensis TaxID=30415 RepID=A0ABC9XD87_GRUJA